MTWVSIQLIRPYLESKLPFTHTILPLNPASAIKMPVQIFGREEAPDQISPCYFLPYCGNSRLSLDCLTFSIRFSISIDFTYRIAI